MKLLLVALEMGTEGTLFSEVTGGSAGRTEKKRKTLNSVYYLKAIFLLVCNIKHIFEAKA